MEKADLRSSSTQAKIMGSITSIAGALIVVLYKGSTILNVSSPSQAPPLHSPLASSQRNWVLGGFLLAVAYILMSIWYIVLAFFSIFFSTVVHTWGLHLKGPVYVSIFKPLSIAIAAAMSVIFLGEDLYLGSVVGAVILCIGFYAVIWGKAKEEELHEDENYSLNIIRDEFVIVLQCFRYGDIEGEEGGIRECEGVASVGDGGKTYKGVVLGWCTLIDKDLAGTHEDIEEEHETPILIKLSKACGEFCFDLIFLKLSVSGKFTIPFVPYSHFLVFPSSFCSISTSSFFKHGVRDPRLQDIIGRPLSLMEVLLCVWVSGKGTQKGKSWFEILLRGKGVGYEGLYVRLPFKKAIKTNGLKGFAPCGSSTGAFLLVLMTKGTSSPSSSSSTIRGGLVLETTSSSSSKMDSSTIKVLKSFLVSPRRFGQFDAYAKMHSKEDEVKEATLQLRVQ
ncbi:WAT1-related protein, partial [Mucuna pruriens]